jgi:hypothetical protein
VGNFFTKDVNSSLIKFLSKCLVIFEVRFLYTIWVMMEINVGLPRASGNHVKEKEVCTSLV